MTHRSCTPPSGLFGLVEPSRLRKNLNRASRAGPSIVMNDGNGFCNEFSEVTRCLGIRADERKRRRARARSADRGLRVATRATVAVEAWAQAVVISALHRLHFLKTALAIQEIFVGRRYPLPTPIHFPSPPSPRDTQDLSPDFARRPRPCLIKRAAAPIDRLILLRQANFHELCTPLSDMQGHNLSPPLRSSVVPRAKLRAGGRHTSGIRPTTYS